VVEGEPELVSIGIALDVQLIDKMFQADNIMKHSLVGFAELEDRKRVQREPMISFEWQDLDSYVSQLRALLAAEVVRASLMSRRAVGAGPTHPGVQYIPAVYHGSGAAGG
jgi:hypothetical protein